MRQFVVCGHDAPTTPEFPLDDLPSAAGRLDVLCRCVNSALFLSHGIREDVRVHLVFQDELTVSFDGSSVRRLNPDERSTAATIRNALEEKAGAIGHQPATPAPGVELYRMGLAATLDRVGGTVVELHEDGDPVGERDPIADPTFVLSDHQDFTSEEADLLAERSGARVRLGPALLHADHAITVAHNWLDTEGYTRY
ncbi:tRNA (pseudouridine(54)-N(1))-methyltransferase TrmY [Halorarius litoreus]|uniref:tRNA (pseudouridine(54)-N(1))-methyltransferase TrmY n=1 Tax=Halorarius litoreus TaxID=2962676 RepID=UPI0020CD5F6F|nr:tRNA (pseudouridine(54)-N(1))-methyltransferase TrmY [Halorarius litoreus]